MVGWQVTGMEIKKGEKDRQFTDVTLGLPVAAKYEMVYQTV